MGNSPSSAACRGRQPREQGAIELLRQPVQFHRLPHRCNDALGQHARHHRHDTGQIGVALRSDGWAGAQFWSRGNGGPRSLDELLDRAEVATYLGMPVIAVHEVTTFYNMYNQQPVGRFKLNVCTNLPCQLRDGVRALRGALSNPLPWSIALGAAFSVVGIWAMLNRRRVPDRRRRSGRSSACGSATPPIIKALCGPG